MSDTMLEEAEDTMLDRKYLASDEYCMMCWIGDSSCSCNYGFPDDSDEEW